MSKTFDLRRAESILSEAISNGLIDVMPENEKDRIGMAEELVKGAVQLYEEFHSREPAVLAILFAADVDGGSPSGTKPEGGYSEPIDLPFEDYDSLSIADIKERMVPSTLIVYEKALRYEQHGKKRPTLIKWLEEKLEEDTQNEETPEETETITPSQETNEATEESTRPESALDLIVDDFTSLSDNQVRTLHSQFNAIASRAAHMVVLEENKVQDCKLVADARRNALLSENSDSKKSVSLLDAEISDDKELSEWRKKQHEHEKSVRLLKMERDVANSNVERLSREWTMRTSERNGSGQLSSGLPVSLQRF